MDCETRFDERCEEMFKILKEYNFSGEKIEEIEDLIYSDHFYTYESFRTYLKQEKKKLSNYNEK